MEHGRPSQSAGEDPLNTCWHSCYSPGLDEGININITLIFAIENYRQVVEAYLRALEERSAKGQDISHIASVASFFVSRVDVLVDPLLEEKITAVGELLSTRI